MRKSTIVIFILFNLCLFGFQDAGGLEHKNKQRIQSGILAARYLIIVMSTVDSVKWMASIGGVAAPMMTFVSIGIDLAFSFMDIDSPELAAMKTEFSKVNDRLDQFSVHFEEIKRKINWSAMQIKFEKLESSVRILNEARMKLNEIKDKEMYEAEKTRFLQKYESDFKLSSEKLFQAMSSETILSQNIFDAARINSQNHERQTFEFMKGIVKLLIQAFSIQASYMKLKHNDTVALDFFTKIVEKKMKLVQENAQRVQAHIRKVWESQMQKDVRDLAIMSKGTPNRNYAEMLYKYLDDKYPWRNWFALAYADAKDSRKHAAHTCYGAKLFRVGQRNTVVGSIDKNATTIFSKSWAHDKIRTLRKFRVKNNYGEELLNKVRPFNTEECAPAIVTAVVRRQDHRGFVADAWIYTDKNRLHWEEFCVFKCNTDLCWVKKDKCFAVIFWG